MPSVATSAYNTARAVANLIRSLVNDANPQVYAQVPILSISRSATGTVTVTTSTPHGLIPSDQVVINGVLQSNFNGQFLVSTVINALQFTYTQTNPATGVVAIDAINGATQFPPAVIDSISQIGNLVTVNCGSPHSLVPGVGVIISGVTIAGYNAFYECIATPSTTSFQCIAPITGLGPSSGGTAQNTAVTISVSGGYPFVTGQMVTMSGIPVPGYNGTFPIVAQTPTIFQYIGNPVGNLAPSGGGTASAGAATTSTGGFSGALGLGTWATDPLLMPYINSAYRKTQRAIANAGGGGFIQDDALFVLPAVSAADASLQVSITDSTAPPNTLPPNLLVPSKLWERQNLSTDDFCEMTDLSQRGGLPSRPQGQTLNVWEWRADGLYFLGALVDVQIRMRFLAVYPDLTDGTSPIFIRNAQECLAYGAAGEATNARGAPTAEKFEQLYSDALEDVIGQNVKQMQHGSRRRRPFRARLGIAPNRGSW